MGRTFGVATDTWGDDAPHDLRFGTIHSAGRAMTQSSQSSGRNDAGAHPGTDAGLPDARARSAVLPQTPPTLATVADEAGVSRQTVSNALNNPELLRPETLE